MPALPSVDLTSSLETSLGYSFQNRPILLEALTHSTYVHEHPDEGGGFNERLEFLGDAVLGLVVGEYLLGQYPDDDEGILSKRKAQLVQESILARWAAHMGLGGVLRLGKGEEISGGRGKPSLLSDALEAVIAAIFLDGGWDAVRGSVRAWIPWLEREAAQLDSVRDYKTELQERAQRLWNAVPTYDVSGAEGPEHRKVFSVTVGVNGRRLGDGQGQNKKEAAQAAARAALAALGSEGGGAGPGEDPVRGA